MNFSEIYEKLHQQWTEEIRGDEITSLSEKSYKEFLEVYSYEGFISTIEESISIKDQLTNSFLENFRYILNDLLKIRKQKLINRAMNVQEIKKDNLLEHENRFYDNLIAAFKGYEHVKGLVLSKIDKITPDAEIAPSIPIESPSENETSTNSVRPDTIKEVDYVNIRFIKNCPALVGDDMVFYGPFEKNDVCALPLENANILIQDKIAEKIEIRK
jgi:DNA replication initiation complex subunit (GINS family)